MRPSKLSICGWGPYKGLVEIDFTKFEGKGLFLITGATGAGKTTIFDAITYALYGALSGEMRDKERSSVRSDFADAATPTYVELTMEHAGETFRIYRNPEYLRPKKRGGSEAGFTKEKENAILHREDGRVVQGAKEVNAALYEILGLDVYQFKQISMIAQGEFARLLTAAPKDKTKIFREIFATGIYEKFANILSQRAKEKYIRVSQQKAKLEEDIHAFLQELDALPIEQELKDEVRGLPLESGVPTKSLEEILFRIESFLDKQIAAQEEVVRQTSDVLSAGRSELAKQAEENKRIARYKQAKEKKEQLEKRREEVEGLKERLKEAGNAANVEPAEVECRHASTLKEHTVSMVENVGGEATKERTRLKEREGFIHIREEIEAFIQSREALAEEREGLEKLSKELDKFKTDLDKHKEKYVSLESDYSRKKKEYDELFVMWRRETVGIVAKMLVEGEPCPVCGSVEHPHSATASDTSISEEAVERAQSICDMAKEAMDREYEILLLKKGQAEELEKRRKETLLQVDRLTAVVEEKSLSVPVEFAEKSCPEARRLLQGYIDEVLTLQTSIAEKEKLLAQLTETLTVQEKAYHEAQENYRKALNLHGFESEEAYKAAYLPRDVRDEMTGTINSYQEEVVAIEQLLQSWKESLSTMDEHDLSAIEMALTEAQQRGLMANKSLQKLLMGKKDTQKLRMQLAEKEAVIENATKEYGFVKELENIATGANPKKLVFEQYVLAGYFEEILRAANLRFAKMSGGRYEMHRNSEVSDGRVKDNLEIEVMDYYTGRARSVRTLSGGETFKASLCLALGLSDVISSMSGGLFVDTLFIDEGFGALDSESLDQACGALQSLVENKRMIGIISHVPELRERISSQLVIEKTGSGSNVKIVS